MQNRSRVNPKCGRRVSDSPYGDGHGNIEGIRKWRNRLLSTILLATNNPGKLTELRSLLADMQGLTLISPADLGLHLDILEDGATYAENAAKKALAFAQASGNVAMADDSGLELDALNGAPGLISARYAPKKDATDADRRAYLLSQLGNKSQPWTARFRSTVCLATPDGVTHFAEGICEGSIIPEERGTGGFGYDPIFLLQEEGKTMAELTMAEKNSLSHRARAIAAIKKVIVEELYAS